MDSKLLLVKIITLLYKESCSPDTSGQSSQLIRSILNTIKFPETGLDVDNSRESLQALRATALWMCENPADHSYDRAALLQRIRVNVGDDEGMFYAFQQGIDENHDETVLKKQILEARATLREHFQRHEIQDFFKRYSQKVLFRPEEVNWRTLPREAAADLEKFLSPISADKMEGMMEEIDMSNLDHVSEVLTRGKTEALAVGTIKMGWQALNRSTGEHCGFRRGEFIDIGALQHMFKTGFTLNILKHGALYNTPYMLDPKKKPCLLHISTENEPHQNILWLYTNLMENETGVECDISNVSIPEATQYVHDKLSATGYHVKMCRFNPTDMTYHTLFDLINRLESEGYEIHMIVFDYLNMISKKGCTQGAQGQDTRDLFRRVRNFTSERNITFVTPVQLSNDAKRLKRGNVPNFVQEVVGKGYYDSCGTIDQEVDLEYLIDIVKVNGESYLTVQRGKHRKVRPTLDKYHYFVLPFSPVGGIRDDINGPDTSRKHPGGGVIGSAEERPWWNTESPSNHPV